jgi:hypothetical protein
MMTGPALAEGILESPDAFAVLRLGLLEAEHVSQRITFYPQSTGVQFRTHGLDSMGFRQIAELGYAAIQAEQGYCITDQAKRQQETETDHDAAPHSITPSKLQDFETGMEPIKSISGKLSKDHDAA